MKGVNDAFGIRNGMAFRVPTIGVSVVDLIKHVAKVDKA